MSDRLKFALITVVFLVAYFLPLQHPRVQSALGDMFLMRQDYARKHEEPERPSAAAVRQTRWRAVNPRPFNCARINERDKQRQ